ncbi:MAG: sigma-70 family RNA polymerase sigma factor [Acidobacteria bacterium]|nr:sigma-70 family RNA polymerase sigma factor [Acidobacteriota bacterium]
MRNPKDELTLLLKEFSSGSENSYDELFKFVYENLHLLAQRQMQNERTNHTLQATALVHETYLRLVDWQNVSWQNRAHFFSVAAQVMRKILVDHARKRNAQKRGSGQTISLDENINFSNHQEIDTLKLEEALLTMEKMDVRQAKIVELRFFGGLSVKETAYALNISESTVKREWQIARLWFQNELDRNE